MSSISKPKNPIKFAITLNQEQKEAKEKILNSKITFLKGVAGDRKSTRLNSSH